MDSGQSVVWDFTKTTRKFIPARVICNHRALMEAVYGGAVNLDASEALWRMGRQHARQGRRAAFRPWHDPRNGIGLVSLCLEVTND